MTFIDMFISRSAIFQDPDHRLALGKTGQEADLAPDPWPDPCILPPCLASALGFELNKWSTFGGSGDGDLRDPDDEDAASTVTLPSWDALDHRADSI